jgi:hypothetical protein
MIPFSTIPTVKAAAMSMAAKGVSTTGLKPLMLGTQQPQSTPGQQGPVAVGAASPNAPVDPNAPDPNAVDPAELQKSQDAAQKSQAALQQAQAATQHAQLQIAQHKQEAAMAKAQVKQVQAQAKHQQEMMTGGDAMHKSFIGQKMLGITKALNKMQSESLQRKFAAEFMPTTWAGPTNNPADSRVHTGRAGPPVTPGDLAPVHAKLGLNPDGTSTWGGIAGDIWGAGRQILSHPKDSVNLGMESSGWSAWADRTPHADWRNTNTPGTLDYYGKGLANVITNGAEQVGYGLKQAPGWFANQGGAAVNIVPGAYHAAREMHAAANAAGGYGKAQVTDLLRPWAAPAGDTLRTAMNLIPGGVGSKLLSRIPGAMTSMGFDAIGHTLDRLTGGEAPAPTASGARVSAAPKPAPAATGNPDVMAQIMQWANSLKGYMSGAASRGGGYLTQMAHGTLPSEAGPHILRNPYYLR